MELFAGLPVPRSCETDGIDGAVSRDFASSEATQEPRISVKRKCEELPDSKRGGKQSRLVLKGYSAELQGEREAMEDRFCLVDIIADERITKHQDIFAAGLYGIFDGHNGVRAANFIADGFLNSFLSLFILRGGATATDLDVAISTNFTATYKSMDAEFLTKCIKQKPVWKDGSTATTILSVNSDSIFVANVGDSQSILCRYDPVSKQHKPVILTTEHSPALYEERTRIQQAGGHVKDNRLDGVLELSRSLGDLPYKKGTGLISTPSIRKVSLTPHDKFIVVACDGLWKSFTPTEVLNRVLETVENAKEEEADAKFSTACVKLTREAVKRLTGDNVTVLIIRISARIPDAVNSDP